MNIRCVASPVICAIMLSTPALAQTRLYVDADASGANDGTSWTDAYTDLQDALDDAVAGSGDYDIWIADGLYIRSGGGSRDGFVIAAARNRDFRLLGGFDGTETSLDDRAGLFSQTILSGNRGNPASATDNAYNVLSNHGVTYVNAPGPNLTLDGMVIEDGYADGYNLGEDTGGGVYSAGSLHLVNCAIRDNYAYSSGGGVYVNGGTALAGLHVAVTASQSSFTNNACDLSGGALFVDAQGEVSIHTCTIKDNSAGGLGGGVYASNRWLFEIINSEVSSNTSDFLGGGVYLHQKFEQRTSDSCPTCPPNPGGPQNPQEDDPNTPEDETLENLDDLPVQTVFFATTFADNAADDGSAVYLDRPVDLYGNPVGLPRATAVLGCNIYANQLPTSVDAISGPLPPKLVSYTNYEGGWTGAGSNNVDLDPYFIDASAKNFRLRPGSPLAAIGHADLLDADLVDLDIDSDTSELVFFDRPDLDDDAVTDLEAIPLDLHGFAREIGGLMDYGAYEVCRADSNLDGAVTPADFSAWVQASNANDVTIADVNADGVVTPADYNAWIQAFNNGCN